MKRRDLIKKLTKAGWYQKREGSNHDIWTDGKHVEEIPRHREINEQLAKDILKKYGLK